MKPRINYKSTKFTLFIITCLILTLLIPGCNQAPPQDEPEPSQTPTEPASPLQSDTPAPSSGVSPSHGGSPVIRISKAPRVGEIVDIELTWELLGTPIEPFNKVWLEFERYDPALYYPLGRGTSKERTLRFLNEDFDPSDPKDVYRLDASTYQPVAMVPHEEIIVEGNLVRQGAPLTTGEKVQLAGKVRFPEEGEWVVYCRFQAEGEFPYSQSEVRLTVNKESGTFGWSDAYSKGSGSGWSGPKENAPIAITMKPGRAPLLGEPLDLTITIQSIRDVPEGEVYLRFFRQEGSFSNKDVDYSIERGLNWSGSLKKDVAVELSGKVTFNEEGDWAIQALSKTPEMTSLSGANKHNIYLHVGKESSRYGWTGSEGPQSPPVEGTPTPAPKPASPPKN